MVNPKIFRPLLWEEDTINQIEFRRKMVAINRSLYRLLFIFFQLFILAGLVSNQIKGYFINNTGDEVALDVG
jgi:hypothetical protein